jgi:type IV secretory pathway VirB6-like protein
MLVRGIKKNMLNSNVRKSIKHSISYDERWILRQIANNPKLRATKLAVENIILRQFEEY